MQKSNFDFLNKKWSMLADLGKLAEKNIYEDSNTALIKLGMFAELLVQYMFAYENLNEPEDNKQATKIKILNQYDLLPYEIDQILYTLRVNRNKAAHEAFTSVEDAKTAITLAHKLGTWFMQTYGDWDFEPDKFVMPEKIDDKSLIENLKQQNEQITREYEEKTKQLEQELNSLRIKLTDEEKAERLKKSFTAASMIQLNEAETRKLIDEQLKRSGWEADSENLKYSKGTRPERNRNIAIAEWPTEAVGTRKSGKADYALFSGLKLVGLIEAKRESKDIPGDIDQAKEYAINIRKEDYDYIINRWGDYKVPFLFATNGRKYLKQLETKSGIWFLDARKSTNHPKALQAWYTPEGLKYLLEADIEKANKNLQEETFDYLIDQRGLGLRDYQVRAIKAVEHALEKEQRRILLSMATGTGKTRTIIGLIYRLIKSKRFKRVLFLVDRSALGEQAEDTFKEAIFEDLLTFTKVYDVKGLNDKFPEAATKVHIATVQGMVKRIMYSEDEQKIPSIDDYDCIVVDEAHRGYILDKEMGDIELEFRSQNDYISKYNMVLDYFDAVKIALTATPALHTTAIFGKPIFEYSYREAVIDGHLVDHEPPHDLITQLRDEGITFKKGEKVPIYDPITHDIINSDELPDDLNLDIEKFNTKVITKGFNRTVLQEILKDIDPDGPEKTLIFAVQDTHADMIVRLIKELYEEMGIEVEDDAVMKITGSINDPLSAIKKFKNEIYPTIVVTVDLLTTGVDVPEICNLVFLRRVKSRILYEQMLGRATRLCPSISKTHFNIYDPVGIYESLQPITKMKPVVANNKIKFTMLLDELLEINSEVMQKNHINEIIAKLQRKKQNLDKDELEHFKLLSGGYTPNQFIEKMKTSSQIELIEELKDRAELFSFLDEYKYNPTKMIISNHEDKLLEHRIGYGKGEKPEDYLKEFGDFINNNMNKIPALEIVCKSPKELTRAELKALKLELDRHGYTKLNLNTAWNQIHNADIVADIISFVRQQALGSALIDHRERIENAMKKVRNLHKWNKIQLNWLDRIENQLVNEEIIDKSLFDEGAFKNHGGYDRINKVFEGKLDEVIDKIKDNLFDERGTTA